MGTINSYIKSRRRRLDVWRDEIGQLKEKAAEEDVRDPMRAQLASLDRREKAVRRMLQSLNQFGGDSWKDVQLGVEQACRQLEEALQHASRRFSD